MEKQLVWHFFVLEVTSTGEIELLSQKFIKCGTCRRFVRTRIDKEVTLVGRWQVGILTWSINGISWSVE